MNAKMNEIIQWLLGDTKIEVEGGYYVLDIQDEGEEIQVTVDYERTERDGELVPTGRNCVFNETYLPEEFNIEQLSADLHAQDLCEVDAWVASFARSKGWEPA